MPSENELKNGPSITNVPKKDKQTEELSEDDKLLKDGLELAVTRLQEDDTSLHKPAVDYLVNEIKSATASMTSVPKPLKFLKNHYDTLKELFEKWKKSISVSYGLRQDLADVLSVLAMTMAAPSTRECLKFKLQGAKVNISSWGHEYVRSLAGEISEEYNQRIIDAGIDDEPSLSDLMALVEDILPFQLKHNAEAEAVDLLLEIRQLNKLVDSPLLDERNYERIGLYLIRSAGFLADPDDLIVLYQTAFKMYKNQRKFTEALRIALKMDNPSLIAELFQSDLMIPTPTVKQMALILARDRNVFSTGDEAIDELIGNCNLSARYLDVARDLDLLAPRSPEDIYKSHLSTSTSLSRGFGRNNRNSATLDSSRANLASTFVNAFVNAGYCKDKLMMDDENKDNGWLYKNKNHGMLSATASLGMVMMWNVDEGLNEIDKYFHNSENYVKAGACLGVGIIATGVRNESDPSLAILSDFLEEKYHSDVRTAAVCGLGIAYAGAQKDDMKVQLEAIVSNTDNANITEVSMAGLALGLSYVGTCDDDISSVILQRLMEATDIELNHTSSRFLCLGLGLLYLGKCERADVVIEAIKTIEHKRGKYGEITLETCAYAGSGNVLKVQQMLRYCTDHIMEAEAASHQAVAVLGIGLITAGEEIGTEMTLRTFEHLLHYGEIFVRRAVPLAIGLLYVSNPEYSIIDQLSRLSHDQDAELSQCAIFSLGLVSAGSNNSRVAGLLRQLSDFYAREENHLFMVRIAQGLNALGKGLLGLNPFHSDRLLMNGPGMAGILVVLHACLDIKGTILSHYHYILYFLSISMNPRYMCTVDEELQPIPCSVRVGQAVETVGQAGRPKTITGFQTHTSPVLLGFKDRAELAGNDFTSLTSVLEGMVIVNKNPELVTALSTSSVAGLVNSSSSSNSSSSGGDINHMEKI